MISIAAVARLADRLRVVQVGEARPQRRENEEHGQRVPAVGRRLRRQEIQPGQDLQVSAATPRAQLLSYPHPLFTHILSKSPLIYRFVDNFGRILS